MGAAGRTAETWARSYPRDALPHMLHSGLIDKEPGRYTEAIAEATKAIALDPDFAIGYYNLAVNHAYRDELDEAAEALRRGRERGLDAEEYLMLDYDLAFLHNDRAAMERVAAAARARLGAESWISSKEACALAYGGQMGEARRMIRQAVDQALQAKQAERAGAWIAGAAVWEALFGNAKEANEQAQAALRFTTTRDAEYGAGFAMALAGNQAKATAIADDLERRLPMDTAVRLSYLPTLRAELALKRGDPAGALDLLEIAVPHELGATPSSLHASFGALYPIYVRGEAYLARHNGAAAAAEFAKITEHRGIVVSDPIGALAQLQLARSYVIAGQKDRAKSQYQTFLLLWVEANPNLPVLTEARREYGKLL